MTSDGAGMPAYETVQVDIVDRVATVTLDRPEKRNAMNPTMHREMNDVLSQLEADPTVGVVVLTGAGSAWCAGQDLKETFHDLWGDPTEFRAVARLAQEWRWHRLYHFPKPTIAMVNGYCFGGGFTQLIACDLAITADEAVFGLSEVNWGTFPAGLVSRVLSEALSYRDAMYLIMTGATFDGRRAAELRLVNESVPLGDLRGRTDELAHLLLDKNPHVLRACKDAYKRSATMDIATAEAYFDTLSARLALADPSGRRKGVDQFLAGDYKPAFEAYDQDA